MTRRSEPKPDCPYCHGVGFVMVTRDPDTDVECVCTDPPHRVQLSRRAGWRKPENTVVVARPTKWGNPIRVDGKRVLIDVGPTAFEAWGSMPSHLDAVKHAVKAFRWQLEHHPNVVGFTMDDVRRELRGKNLACWCALDQPCHADVLLEIANGGGDV